MHLETESHSICLCACALACSKDFSPVDNRRMYECYEWAMGNNLTCFTEPKERRYGKRRADMEMEMDVQNITQNANEIPALKVTDSEPLHKKVVMVIGTTGVGKSTIINMLYNNDISRHACTHPCDISSRAASTTKDHADYESKDGTLYIDTVGLGDADRPEYMVELGIKKFIRAVTLGVHCIVIVCRFGRMSREERNNLRAMAQVFHRSWTNNAIVVLTHYEGESDDGSKRIEIDRWIGDDLEIRTFFDKVRGGIILTDNSLGRNEGVGRPYRRQCLDQLKQFVNDRCTRSVPLARRSLPEMIDCFESIYESYYEVREAASAMKNVVKYLMMTSNNNDKLDSGWCGICGKGIDISELMQADECAHTFHSECIGESGWKSWRSVNTCPQQGCAVSVFGFKKPTFPPTW